MRGERGEEGGDFCLGPNEALIAPTAISFYRGANAIKAAAITQFSLCARGVSVLSL